jgi:hypothetical protein
LNSAGRPVQLVLRPDTAREFHDETLPADGAKVAHFALCVDKILFYEDLTENFVMFSRKLKGMAVRRFIEQGKKFTFKLLTT